MSTFASPTDLNKCASSLDRSPGECAMAFQSNPTDDGDVADILVSVANQRQKVQVMEDWRTLEDLRAQFPRVDPGKIESVWRSQSSWAASFDVLKSVSSSAQCYVTIFCADGEGAWPALPLSNLRADKLPGKALFKERTTSRDDVQDGDAASDWAVVRLSEEDDKASVCDSVDSWAVVETTASKERRRSSIHSYRDAAVLGSKRRETERRGIIVAKAAARTWKPAILVAPVLRNFRIDRVFAVCLTDRPLSEDEEEGLWELCCVGAGFHGQSVPMKRISNSTRVRPQFLDQKLKRIALQGH